jgi:hypothetical protein
MFLRTNSIFSCSIFCVVTTFAQCDIADPCVENFELKRFVMEEGRVPKLKLSGLHDFGNLASSILSPPKPFPGFDEIYPNAVEDEMDCLEAEYSWEASLWDCYYGAAMLTDGNPATAWAEGVEGDGVGEVVMVRIPDYIPNQTRGRIWSGFGKSSKLWLQNNRPCDIKIYLLVGNEYDTTPCCEFYQNLKVVASSRISLVDINGFQEFLLPRLGIYPDSLNLHRSSYFFLAFEILSVYRGSVYNDTCISEVDFFN